MDRVKRKTSSFLIILYGAVQFLASPYAAQIAAQTKGRGSRPNVLLITVDTLRPDRLSCYQSPYLKTPNIDRLAEKGLLFTRAFAHATTTLPSHANILLGATPLFHGVHDNSQFTVQEEFLTLAEYLKDNGYATGAFVGAYVLDSRFGLSQGFDVYDDGYERSHARRVSALERKAEDVVEAALGWLKKQRAPWFLWIHCFDPHDPYDPPQPFKSRFEKNPYDGEVAYVDSALGRLLDEVKAGGLDDETLIVFTGDHGESLGQHEEATHGFLAYNSTLWVPLIVAFPGSAKGTVARYAAHQDIFPTVCDVLGLEKPGFLKGISLRSLSKRDRPLERPVYFESLYPYYSRGWAPIRGFLVEGEKFIDSPIPEIYDLGKDFDEIKNLAGAKDVGPYRKELERIIKSESSLEAGGARRELDRESMEKLRSLGYVSSPRTVVKEAFGPEDDVKVLLSYNNKVIRAVELYGTGRGREGIELLKGVIRETKALDSAYSNLAALYEWDGRRAEALEALRSGLENIPSSYELFFNYVSFLVRAGLFEEALRAIGEMRFPQMENDPELLNQQGLALSRTGELEMAIEVYERALSLDARHPVLHNNLATAHLSFSLKHMDPGSFQKSVESFKKAIELDPGYVLPLNGLGTAYKRAGNLDGAISCWAKALELDPDFGPALYNLGLGYMDKKSYAEALRFLGEYQRKHADSLPPEERGKIESLIKTCRTRLGK